MFPSIFYLLEILMDTPAAKNMVMRAAGKSLNFIVVGGAVADWHTMLISVGPRWVSQPLWSAVSCGLCFEAIEREPYTNREETLVYHFKQTR